MESSETALHNGVPLLTVCICGCFLEDPVYGILASSRCTGGTCQPPRTGKARLASPQVGLEVFLGIVARKERWADLQMVSLFAKPTS
jgi:hypothetical protein